ncbi:hypothetical protein H2203_001824 [Taxawa tesnikishii (nom. ined.)]|nr:hypothetical protein H2203_001824 [Dothideales sp. JES 119]
MPFPIQTANINTNTHRRTPSPVKAAAPALLPESLASPTGSTDTNLLTALAAQERRVLELKEELQRAEQDLKRLKHDWMAHEAQKKRHDARRVQKLQSLNTTLPGVNAKDDDANGGSAWLQQEMERRKALLSGTKASSRTVFSGSRHARTLSLLSPVQPSAPSSFRRMDEPRDSHTPPSLERPPLPKRASTNQDLTREVVEKADENIDLGLPRDVLLKTGKQMASDFKDGLWTFIEDLRQATVGDEAVNGTYSRTQSVSNSIPGVRCPENYLATRVSDPQAQSPGPKDATHDAPLIDVGNSFWEENGLPAPKIAEAPIRRRSNRSKPSAATKARHTHTNSFDSWDNWESPSNEKKTARSNSDTSVSEARTSPSPGRSSPRTSGRDDGTECVARSGEEGFHPMAGPGEAVPGNLRRTASHLMQEWERSLTPPPGVRDGQADYLGKDSKAD